MKIPHMCTIAQAAEEIKASGCAVIGETALRRWIKEGAIPHVRVGNKVLINMDGLAQFLTGAMGPGCPETESEARIRKVPEKI